MTCTDERVGERLQRAGLEIVEEREPENIPPPAAAWGGPPEHLEFVALRPSPAARASPPR